MRILHVMWNMDIGGAERAVYQLIREQRRKGQISDIIILNKVGLYGDLTEKAGAHLHFLKMKRSFDFSIKSVFLRIINEYDIIHFHSAEPYPIYLSTLNGEIRKYYTHRGGVFSYNFLKKIRYKFCGYMFRKYFSGISGNTGEGARAASLLFRIPLNSISVTYNGLDFSLLEPEKDKESVFKEFNIKDNNIYIGTSANLRAWKRIDFLIRAASLLKRENLIFFIFGDGPEMANLINLTTKLNVKEKVIFAGKKKHIADYLQILDIFILPSESLESFGNSAVEAMATGIPTIVMNDGGGLIEHIIDGKTGFIAKDKNDLISIVRNLYLDKELRRTIGNAGKEYVRNKYSLEKMLESYNNFYKKK